MTYLTVSSGLALIGSFILASPLTPAQSISGLSFIQTPVTQNINTYSETAVDYAAQAYYAARAEGVLFENGVQIRAGWAEHPSNANGAMTATASINKTYQLTTVHNAICQVALVDEHGNILSWVNQQHFGTVNPSNVTSYTFLPNGGATNLSSRYIWLGNTVVAVTTTPPTISFTSINAANPLAVEVTYSISPSNTPVDGATFVAGPILLYTNMVTGEIKVHYSQLDLPLGSTQMTLVPRYLGTELPGVSVGVTRVDGPSPVSVQYGNFWIPDGEGSILVPIALHFRQQYFAQFRRFSYGVSLAPGSKTYYAMNGDVTLITDLEHDYNTDIYIWNEQHSYISSEGTTSPVSMPYVTYETTPEQDAHFRSKNLTTGIWFGPNTTLSAQGYMSNLIFGSPIQAIAPVYLTGQTVSLSLQ